ncbi:hypothetical protein [Amaricoccus sp.]|uniref:hypothetical protein n=1 Tax=Amaricoccus sp. TaxID=1872485 RepID=UPI001B6A0377|nr:hypothetical protein [Amaricoccus sp.]MBP7241874.1 hypothetical protein [Amaricoccus sp.]
MRAITLAAAALALAGCAGGDVFGFGPAVRGGGWGLPATRAEARPDSMTPPGRRDLGLSVRAFATETDGSVVEIKGATCRVTGGAFAANLATPGRLVIADLGPDAPALTARCTAGALEGAAAVLPDFSWSRGGGNPPQRIAWGMGWTYGYAKVGPLRYPNLRVMMQ